MVPTISNTLSKFDLREEMSLSFASLEDAASRPGGGKKQAAISNERIHRGEELLNTYVVRSNAIPGGMGNVWKVYHKSWNTELAMKRPQPVFFAEAGERRKQVFIAECEHWINLGLICVLVRFGGSWWPDGCGDRRGSGGVGCGHCCDHADHGLLEAD